MIERAAYSGWSTRFPNRHRTKLALYRNALLLSISRAGLGGRHGGGILQAFLFCNMFLGVYVRADILRYRPVEQPDRILPLTALLAQNSFGITFSSRLLVTVVHRSQILPSSLVSQPDLFNPFFGWVTF
jgi:hypothetical protein